MEEIPGDRPAYIPASAGWALRASTFLQEEIQSKCAVLYTLRSVRLTFNELRLAQCRAKLFDFCQGGSGSDCGDCHSDVSFPRTTSSKALVSFVDEIKVEKNKHRRKEINTGVGKYTRIILPGRLWCVLKSARD